jgi:hypothetical protein
MPTLPFAPRPLAGEGLSSWVARLAAHNFVTPADFWANLGCDDVLDTTLPDDLVDRLSARTCLDAGDLRRSFAPDPASAAAPLAVTWPSGIRGAACPACCRAAAEKGGDHCVSAASAGLWRVSCPEHRIRLAWLDGYRLVAQDGGARFCRERSTIGIGATGLTARPAELSLTFEDTIMGALSGQPPGPDWLPRTPASFLASAAALIEVVLWRRTNPFAFAHEFDEIRNGSETLSVGPDDRRRGAELLADQGPRNRMNVCAALATLLARPAARTHPFAILMGWNRSDSAGPFAYLFGEFDDQLRTAVAGRLEAWPDCIATPARRGLQRF